jgi:hypothetical protein
MMNSLNKKVLLFEIVAAEKARLSRIEELQGQLKEQSQLGYECSPEAVDGIMEELELLEEPEDESPESVIQMININKQRLVNKPLIINNPVFKKSKLGKLLTAAAAVFLVLFINIIICYATGNDIFGGILGWSQSLLDIPEKQMITKGNRSVIITSDVHYYKTVEEGIKKEKLNIMYPRDMEDYKADYICFSDFGEFVDFTVIYKADNKKISFSANTNYAAYNFDSLSREPSIEKYVKGYITFYIFESEGDMQASWSKDKYNYSLVCPTKEELKRIIDKLR